MSTAGADLETDAPRLGHAWHARGRWLAALHSGSGPGCLARGCETPGSKTCFLHRCPELTGDGGGVRGTCSQRFYYYDYCSIFNVGNGPLESARSLAMWTSFTPGAAFWASLAVLHEPSAFPMR